MSELPVGWLALKLGDVVDYASNTTVQPDAMQPDAWLLELEDIERDSSRLINRATVAERKPLSAKNAFQAGDVLYGKLRPYLNKVLRADKSGYCSSEIIPIAPGQIDGGYLFHYLRSPYFLEYVRAVTHGVRMPRLGTNQAKEAPFPLAPLGEQKRIAQKLDALLAQVDALKARIDAIPALLQKFRRATLSAATNGNLTQGWRECVDLSAKETADQYIARIEGERRHSPRTKFKLPVAPDTETRTPEIPASWALCSVSAFAECLDNMRVPVKKELRSREGGAYPYFGANGEVDRVDDFIFDDDLVLVTEDETFYGRTKPIAYKFSGKCWVNNHVHVLRAHDVIGQSFLCYTLMHYDVIPWLTGTTGRAKLTQGALMALPIGVPPPDEQAEIVRRIEQLFALADQLEARVSAAQQRIDTLTQSLLAKAFRGELVPQDPIDEPASALLERISAQNTAATKPKRGRTSAMS